ncbi:MAG: glycosyltransferase family 39 protein [Chthoniobacterales bacterium]
MSYWDVWESKKLLDYGVFERQGALINVHFMTGVLPSPERFNYVNHPYPIHWVNTLWYYICGPAGIVLFNALLGLATVLIVFAALKQFFDPRTALVGALLYTLAPSTILFDVDMNQSAMGAMLWPLSFLIFGLQKNNQRPPNVFWLAFAIFIFGQVTWSIYTIIPCLLLMTTNIGYTKDSGLQWEIDSKTTLAILIGTFVTGCLFALQILYYTYSWGDLFKYVMVQTNGEARIPLLNIVRVIALRMILSVGFAVSLGAIVGAVLLSYRKRINSSELGTLIYPVIFLASSLILPRYFYTEIHMYEYLIFPLTVISCVAIQNLNNKKFEVLLLCLGVIGACYPLLQSTIPKQSNVAKALSKIVESSSKPGEVVATNLELRKFPFANWDIAGIDTVAKISDRLFKENISSQPEFTKLLAGFKTDLLNVVFIYSASNPISPEFLSELQNLESPQAEPLTLPAENPQLALYLRNFYWKLTGKFSVNTTYNHPIVDKIDLQIFHLTLTRSNNGNVIISAVK